MVNETPQSPPSAESNSSLPPSASARLRTGAELDRLDRDRSRVFAVAGIVLAVIAAAIVLVWLFTKPKPQGGGRVEDAFAVALPEDHVLATIQVSFSNTGSKQLWIREVKARLTGADGQQHEDTAASGGDFERYFTGYPELRGHTIQPLKIETKVSPGGQIRGSVVASFPVTLDAFNHRKALAVIVTPYASFVAPTGDNAIPIVITEAGR